MFQFNFNSASQDKAKSENPDDDSERVQATSKYDECIEVFPSDEQTKDDYFPLDLTLNSMVFENSHKVAHISIDALIDKLSEDSDDINCAEQNHSDVVPGVYEGGAKIWECTQDLGHFLTNKTDDTVCMINKFRKTTVLDLGCGAGILGILALKNGATVHFQDYNKTVLQHITIPNVLANVALTSDLKECCRFYSGDWMNYVQRTLDDVKFDFILTSETIYNVKSYGKIINILKKKLKPNGICYLAAKLHYFGVGGSLRQFESVLLDEKLFKSETVYVCNENVSREILKITFKTV